MDSFEMPASAGMVRKVELRLVRVNPLTLDPGALVLMGARQLENGTINQFPVHLEYKTDQDYEWKRAEVVTK